VTLPLLPVSGRVVRIQLIGKSAAGGGFGEITEVANAKNASDGAPVAKGGFGIHEIEFYEAAR
jgi:beta-galactosidase